MNAAALAATALVVTADATSRERWIRVLTELGFAARAAASPAAAAELSEREPPRLVVVDMDLPEQLGFRLLRQFVVGRDTAVIAMTGATDLRTAGAAGREGAWEIVDRAAGDDGWRDVVRRLPAPAPSLDPLHPTVVHTVPHLFRLSEKMRRVEQLVARAGAAGSMVLIQGDSGVGKELVARALHHQSTPQGPWARMNCVSLPAELLEVELFGREGSSSDDARRRGRLSQAHGGTLLLKEVGDLPPSVQAKLVRFLDDGEFCRTGGREVLRATVRIVATTRQNLAALVAAGTLGEDLRERLQAISFVVPPLRERTEEIEPLQAYFRQRFSRQFNRESPELTRATLELMLAYAWPGNVRELESLVKHYVVLGDEEHLRAELRGRTQAIRVPLVPGAPARGLEVGATTDLRAIGRQAAMQAERAVIAQVLEEVQWNRAETARRLRISYKTLLTKLAQAEFGRKSRRRSDR